MKVKNNVLPKTTADKIANKLRASLIIQNQIHLSDRKRKAPSLEVYSDDMEYFDPQEYQIHIGAYGPLSIFKVENEAEYASALQYLYGHENQHVRSTASKPYAHGIELGTFAVIEYIAAKEGITKHFRNKGDYKLFLENELPKKGVHVKFNVLTSIIAGIMNSVEDGRIERIRSNEFPNFERQRRYFRAKFWDDCDVIAELKNDPDVDLTKMTTDVKLNLLLNNILMLSTTNLYMKDFAATFYGTDLMDETMKFMPMIANGILAKKTRDMADNVVKISKQLAPYIYEVTKMSDAEIKMQQMLQDMMKNLIMQALEDMADTSEREEEEDDGIPNSVFSQTNLVVTLPDDVYDKLMEKMKEKKGSSSGGVMIRREHPLEDEEKKEGEQDKNGNGSGSNGKSEDKAQQNGAGSGNGESKQNGKKKPGASGGSADDGEDTGLKAPGQSSGGPESQNGQSNGSNGENGESGNQSQNGSNSNSSNSQNGNGKDSASSSNKNPSAYDKTYSKSENAPSKAMNDPHSQQGSHSSGISGDASMVHAEMEAAAKECQYDANNIISNINQSVSHTTCNNRGTPTVAKNTDRPITAAEVKNICKRGFEENRREYKLDQKLPTVLAARARTFRKKNERYFRSLSTPNVTNLDSGSIDPSLIYGLTFGETNVFRRIGEDRKFDGCVYVLVDNSGSMSGKKRMEACKAAAVIEEGFKGLIPMKMVAFDSTGVINHEIIKGFDESQKLNCCWNFAQHGRCGCGNEDDKDILIAQKELLERPEEKKLLIVLSDGAPSSVDGTKKAIADTRKKGIEVFGIYFEEGEIGSDADEFRYMYQRDYVCCKLSEVDNHLTRLMMKFSRS